MVIRAISSIGIIMFLVLLIIICLIFILLSLPLHLFLPSIKKWKTPRIINEESGTRAHKCLTIACALQFPNILHYESPCEPTYSL